MVADDMCMPDDGTALMTLTVYPILGGGKYVKSSGTLEAAAFTSGAVALMQSRNTTLKTKPDVVKRLLKANAHSVPNGAKSVYGDGAIDLKAVYNGSVPSSYSQNHDPMDSVYNFGTRYEAARGGFHLLDPKGTAVSPSTVHRPCHLRHVQRMVADRARRRLALRRHRHLWEAHELVRPR